MNTVTFGTMNSYTEWNLSLRPKTRPKPAPRYNYISIAGRSGDLDLTEALGDVYYENLAFSLEFNLVDEMNTWDTTLTTITNYLHGQKMKVTFSDDASYYYYGRVTVNELSSDRTLGILSIDCNFEPYKYKQSKTIKQYTVSAGNTYTFTNSRMSAVPTLTLSAAMTITFNGTSYSLQSGEQKVLGIEFKEGANVIGITTGSGTLKAEWQEGVL